MASVAGWMRERAEEEQAIGAEREARLQASQSRFAAEMAQLTATYETEAQELDEVYVQGLERARHHYEVDLANLISECNSQRASTQSQFGQSRESAELNWRRTRALTIESFENDKKSAVDVGDQSRAAVASYEEQLSWLLQQTQQMLRRRGRQQEDPPPLTMNVGESTADLLKRYTAAAHRTHAALQEVAQWRSTRFLDEGWPVLLFFAVFFAALYPSGQWFGWQSWQWLAASGGLALVIALATRQIMHVVVRSRSRDILNRMQDAFADAKHAVSRAKVTVEREHEQRLKRLEQRRTEALAQADAAWEQISVDIDRESRERLLAIEHRLAAASKQLESRWEEEARPFKEEFPPRIQARRQQFENDQHALHERLASEREKNEAAYQAAWETMSTKYLTGMRAAGAEFSAMSEYCQEHMPVLTAIDWNTWVAPRQVCPALRFGEFDVDLAGFEGGLPGDDRLRTQSRYSLPAVLSFPDSPSMLVEATDEGRGEAIKVLRNVMLRMLTMFPAGKVRFSIFDPTGLGQNFSEFMHLADYDERLVTSRIWTETNHINQRLTDLTAHMENVIQKYLRNEFASIQEYNDRAGEVAEPFQVLVIANFPANFSEETARRLISIATSGARCGVFTLVSVDKKMALPRNFDLADLEAQANTLTWQDGRFVWQPPDLRHFPLSLDLPVEGEILTEVVRAAGEQAKDANRVEVPFSAVVPDASEWWTHDSRHELVVPLGRAGATKLQSMRLGKGTSQHVLVSGKTGSGKSTLMHAIITNLAIHYSPREVEFYLVDFKKGVEFKTYAQWQLPHARVVAIESEREFGMSVLERLDEELRQRGDLFREAGVQSLAGYRDARPDEIMPRLLLVVDEFQEFFVKDDKIAHDASLLLDRLVRQGRAFGIHVLLGSQTLAGAYSLARSTLGQMAVRIALQCSEADAHLILSEDNTAARLLNRPGEAIYNNANGLFEGNHPFQVVWLPDAEREQYLRDLRQLATAQQVDAAPTIVFEGNVAANPADNPLLIQALREPPTGTVRVTPQAWLGAAIAIKEPTHVVFRRQSGHHLLIVGQKEELAAGMLAGAIISLAAGQPCRSLPDAADVPCRDAKFHILDGGGFSADESGWARHLAKRLPLDISLVAPVAVGDCVAEVAQEVQSRVDTRESRPPIYLVIYNLARYRELRKADDDFGFTSFGDEEAAVSPAQHLLTILREGPAVGVHVLLWCDTYNNVTRWFDRQTLREIAHRVLFQMSATDSSNLMDSAAASNLGAMRAICYDDEQGESERFRPYGLPSREWLDHAAELLRGIKDEAENR